jgi:hypothetical protein
MATVRIHGRNVIPRGPDYPLLTLPLYDFNPLADPADGNLLRSLDDGTAFELGPRYYIDVEVPGDRGVAEVFPGRLGWTDPDGREASVLDVLLRGARGQTGYRIIAIQQIH